MEKVIQNRDSESSIEIVESWSDLPRDFLKRKAANASQHIDRPTLHELTVAYTLLFGRRRTGTSPRTLETYWRGASKLLDWCEQKGKKPHQITTEDANRFMVSIGRLSPKSQQVYLTGVKKMINALRWAGLGSGTPFEHIRVIDPTPGAEKADPYSIDELAKMLNIANPRERTLVLLGADAALRVAEVVNLRWSDIDWERKKLTVSGKGGRNAKITATDRLLMALRELSGQRGRVMDVSRRRVQQIFGRLCRDAGVKGRGFHALRHSCGTRLYRITKDILVVQRHLRHSSAKTTELYAHLAEGEYHKAISALGKNED